MSKQLIYKRNDVGGANAYAGSLRVGNYHYNGINSRTHGKYVVKSPMLHVVGIKLSSEYANSDEEARTIIQAGFDEFMVKLNS